jgi:hypothetical protein
VAEDHNFAIQLACLETASTSSAEHCVRNLSIPFEAGTWQNETWQKTNSLCLATIHNGWLEPYLPHVVVLVGGRLACDGQLSNRVILYDHKTGNASYLESETRLRPATLLNDPGINAAACAYIPANRSVYVYGGETNNGYSAALQMIRLGCNPGYESVANTTETDLSRGCRKCEFGKYSGTAYENCTTCPEGLSTLGLGSKSISECINCTRYVADVSSGFV